jgi:glycine betaine/proline transport system ATP-binding protein
MSDIAISINGLYKIFGRRPKKMVEYVKDGISKADLLDKHNHVLGLKDINIDIPAHKISVIMGLSGSGKSTAARCITGLLPPSQGHSEFNGEALPLDYRKDRKSVV